MGPEAVTNVERGQVRHVVSTEPGARHFARASAPANWLCVFDPARKIRNPFEARRYRTNRRSVPFLRPGRRQSSRAGRPRPPLRGSKAPGWGVGRVHLECRDKAALGSEHLSTLRGYRSINASRLPRRLHSLAFWIAEVCDQPIVPWWAAGQGALHRDLQMMIRHHFERLAHDPTTATEKAWRYLFRAWNVPSEHDKRALDLAAEIRRMGWSTTTVRAWSRLLSPHLFVRRPIPRMTPPSTGPNTRRNLIVDVEIKYPKIQLHFALPDEHLVLATNEIRRNLELGIDLATELVGSEGLPIPSIEHDPQLAGDDFHRTYGIAASFFIYVGLLERLTEKDAAAARREMAVWREVQAPCFQDCACGPPAAAICWAM